MSDHTQVIPCPVQAEANQHTGEHTHSQITSPLPNGDSQTKQAPADSSPEPAGTAPPVQKVRCDLCHEDSILFFYHIAYPCRLKRRLTFEEMVILKGTSLSLESLLQLLEEEPPPEDQGKEPGPLVRRVVANQGFHRVSMTRAEAHRRGAALLKNRKRCKDCPANLNNHTDKGYGCIGFIQTPILEEWEQSIMGAVKQIMDTENADASTQAPIWHIWDNGLRGENIRSIRPTIFQHKEGITARMGPFGGKRPITSDQLLELFLCGNKVSLEYLYIFSAFFQKLDQVFSHMEYDTSQPGSLNRYFKALLLASELEVSMHLTPLHYPEQASPPDKAPLPHPAGP